MGQPGPPDPLAGGPPDLLPLSGRSGLVSGAYRVVHPSEADLARAAELELAYADLRLGFVDASTIALAERLNETRIATLDHRHFAAVRPHHCPHLTLLPE